MDQITVNVAHVRRYGPNAALVLAFILRFVVAETGVLATADALADIVDGTGLPELAAHRALSTLRARRVIVSTAEGVRIDGSFQDHEAL